ncbi:hypothetical protein D623_10003236 [Myotis brandtii]|uniref:Uncharacterized protein n=1 Tax=Myotis brandtii TaxID=109478 RepID=S7NYR9_MYOBR|nr:hypothetical protein D623_10003236 [Myotis brandtii]
MSTRWHPAGSASNLSLPGTEPEILETGSEGNSNMPCTPFLEATPPAPEHGLPGRTHPTVRTQQSPGEAQPHPPRRSLAESLVPLPPALQSPLLRRQGNVSSVRVCSLEHSQQPPSRARIKPSQQLAFVPGAAFSCPVCAGDALTVRGELSGGSRDPGTCKAENTPSLVLHGTLRTLKQRVKTSVKSEFSRVAGYQCSRSLSCVPPIVN